jgi:hypothetical protein
LNNKTGGLFVGAASSRDSQEQGRHYIHIQYRFTRIQYKCPTAKTFALAIEEPELNEKHPDL